VVRWSGGLVGLPQLHERPDGSGLPPEALPARDAEYPGDLFRGPLLDVPEEQQVSVAIGEVLHPSADLGPLVERVDQALTKSLVILRARRPYLEDRRRIGLPPIRVRDQAPDDVLGGAEPRSWSWHRRHQTRHYDFTE
jgi:hypothetical protein